MVARVGNRPPRVFSRGRRQFRQSPPSPCQPGSRRKPLKFTCRGPKILPPPELARDRRPPVDAAPPPPPPHPPPPAAPLWTPPPPDRHDSPVPPTPPPRYRAEGTPSDQGLMFNKENIEHLIILI